MSTSSLTSFLPPHRSAEIRRQRERERERGVRFFISIFSVTRAFKRCFFLFAYPLRSLFPTQAHPHTHISPSSTYGLQTRHPSSTKHYPLTPLCMPFAVYPNTHCHRAPPTILHTFIRDSISRSIALCPLRTLPHTPPLELALTFSGTHSYTHNKYIRHRSFLC